MKTKRLLLAFVSTFLFAIGFSRAAEKFDPMSRNVAPASQPAPLPATDSGSSICSVIDDVK